MHDGAMDVIIDWVSTTTIDWLTVGLWPEAVMNGVAVHTYMSYYWQDCSLIDSVLLGLELE